MPQNISTPEYFASKIVNFGFGNGLIAPAYQILITNEGTRFSHQQKESCAVTFGVYLKDAGLKQLQEVSGSIADDFFDQLDDRVEDGLTSRNYAMQVAEAVNIIMQAMLDDWLPRIIETRERVAEIDPLKTST